MILQLQKNYSEQDTIYESTDFCEYLEFSWIESAIGLFDKHEWVKHPLVPFTSDQGTY